MTEKKPFTVLFEDNHLLIVNKASGIPSQPDQSGDVSLIDYVAIYLKEKYQKPGNVFVGLVHRLDRPVSGVIMIARTSKALERMNKAFSTRSISKHYFAVVKNSPPQTQATIQHWLIRNTQKNITRAYSQARPDAQQASLEYQSLHQSQHYHLLKINLHTGRHHQIRAQLSAIGCPIKGDLKYGADRSNPDGSISLHARELIFEHPVSKESIKVVAPLPDSDVWKYFKTLLDQ
ncbi:MAG: RluA family pseudouridine synthase [Cytophagaceae bacterium]|jgi:23S rRNA pseudouridine1911/1915/1917 synthase|nr:RluA family pseudouridine synthase [Cytophagaceae bacterium]